MNIQLNTKQTELLSLLSKKYGFEYKYLLKDSIDVVKYFENIEKLCSVINEEYMMKGINSNWEPNAYGLELNDLLDMVNKLRIDSSKHL